MKKKNLLTFVTIFMFIIMPFTVKAFAEVTCDYKKPGTKNNYYYNIKFTVDTESNELINKPIITFTWVSIKNDKNYQKQNFTDKYSVKFSNQAVNDVIKGKCPATIKIDGSNKKITDYIIAENEYVFNEVLLYDKGKYLDGDEWKDLKEKQHYGTVFCDYIHPAYNMNYYYQLQYKLKWKSEKKKVWYVINKIKYTEIYKNTGSSTTKDVDYDVTKFDSHALYNNDGDDYTKCPLMISVDSKKIVSSYTDIYRLNRIEKGYDSCLDSKTESACKTNNSHACVWNETKFGNYCNVNNLMFVSCGDAYDIPYQVPGLTSFAVNLLKIATPIILIIVSMVSLVKALAASKEDEIKKAQSILIKRLIIAVLIFFVISIVQFVINIVADKSEAGSVESCFKCFLNNECGSSVYYKANVGATHEGIHNYNGEDQCIYFDGTKKTCN